MIKLNLGCGKHPMKGWINYDVEYHDGVTPLDLSRGVIPHDDNSVNFIFSEHFIEHITKEQGIALLKECYRVLKPSGVLRISTPDLSILAEKYHHRALVQIPGVWEPGTPCDMMNEGMRFWGHQYLWDKAYLNKMLLYLRFMVSHRTKDVSAYPELCNLEVRPQYFEMYIEAMK